MALILKGGAIFLHIPKTGGNWVTSVLGQCGLVEGLLGHKHANASRLLSPFSARGNPLSAALRVGRIQAALQSRPFMFCFVRHPLAWYESWFKYMSQPARAWCNWGNERDMFDWHPNAVLNGCGADDFNQFVRNVIARRPGYVSELFAGYAQPQVEFVGRQETLRQDLVKVLNRLNLAFDEEFVMNFGKVGVSPETKSSLTWDPGLRDEVLALERVALLRYGYANGPTAG